MPPKKLLSDDSELLKHLDTKFDSFQLSFKSEIRDLIKTIDYMSKKIDDYEGKLKTMDQDLKEEKTKSVRLEGEIAELKNIVNHLDKRNNNHDQQLLENNIEIFGISEKTNEDIADTIMKVARNVGHMINREDIIYASRVKIRQHLPPDGPGLVTPRDPRPRNIVAKFTSKKLKDELIAAIKKKKGLDCSSLGLVGGKIFINDQLTRKNKYLLHSAKQFKIANNFNFLWVRNSKIYIRKNETSPAILISCPAQLLNLV